MQPQLEAYEESLDIFTMVEKEEANSPDKKKRASGNEGPTSSVPLQKNLQFSFNIHHEENKKDEDEIGDYCKRVKADVSSQQLSQE